MPAKRVDLIVRPHASDGDCVVKDLRTGEFFHLGMHESFLLEGLDGVQTSAQLRASYEQRFGFELSEDDLATFVQLARESGFLAEAESPSIPAQGPVRSAQGRSRPHGKQSLLCWRKSLFDPDWLLSKLEPRIQFVWTRWFAAASVLVVVLASAVAWSNRHELVSGYSHAIGWEMLLVAWLVLIGTTACHEFAHGLTCKHFGGEVREIGALILFFTPCFYCNVSDAWLFREKHKRLLVTLAGGYCDLLLWAGAVLIWRVTLLDSAINYLSWIVLSVCSVRIFFNFNPLLKLDGYYLLSDGLSIHNLRQRSWTALSERIRWLFWGAPSRSDRENQHRFLILFGLASWVFSLVFLSLMILGLIRYFGQKWGVVGFVGALAFGAIAARGLFSGLSSGEVTTMLRKRRIRTVVWLVVLGGAVAALVLIDVNRNASGTFLIRPNIRSEVQAPVSGFLGELQADEGDVVGADALLVRIDVPDLASRIQEKRSEILEIQAKLRECEQNVEYARDDCARAEEMRTASAMTPLELRNTHKHRLACESELEQTKARLDRVRQELSIFESRLAKAQVRSPIEGMVASPHLKERIGQYVEEGDPICVIEGTARRLAEIQLPEQEVSRVRVGARVSFKARSLPFETFHGTVVRIAPSAQAGDFQSSITVYCEIENPPSELQSGMTGYARIECGRRKAGQAALEHVLTYLRTEFWW